MDSLSTKATAYGRAWLPEGTGDGGRQASQHPTCHGPPALPCPSLSSQVTLLDPSCFLAHFLPSLGWAALCSAAPFEKQF